MKYAVCNELFGAVSLQEAASMTARRGFRGLELAPFTVFGDFSGREVERGIADTRRALRDNGLEFAGMHWLLSKPRGLRITASDAGVRRKTRDHLKRLLDAAGELGGGKLILGSPRQRASEPGQTREEATALLADELAAIAPHAAERQSAILLEALSPDQTNVVNLLAEAEAVVRRVGHPGVGGMFDFHNCAGESEPCAALIGRFFAMIGHVHLNDAGGGHPKPGDSSYLPAFAELGRRGYTGWVSLEIFTAPADPDAVLRETIEYLGEIERGLGG
jgi:sugar phosphate isomerase/epimerase